METKKLLNSYNLRATKARIALLKLLTQKCRPLTARGMFIALSSQGVKTDLATVYRILEVFLARGLIKQLDFREGKSRYELAGEHHHHLVCQTCGQIKAVYDEWLKRATQEIQKKYQFHVTEHVLEFFGNCSNCSETKERIYA